MLDIEQYKDKNNIYKKLWDENEIYDELPNFYNNIIEVNYDEFQSKIYENNLKFAKDLVVSLLSGDIYILKEAFSKDYIEKIKRQTIINWKNIKDEFFKMYENCPTFYKCIF